MRVALSTELMTPRTIEPAGISTSLPRYEIRDGRRLEPLLDLRGAGAELGLEPDVDFLPDWNHRRP